VNKTTPREARVGIQTLARSAEVRRFVVSGAFEEGVLMRDASAAEVRILLKPGIYAPLQNLEVREGERTRVYIPQGLAERGEDYDIGRYREMVRES
jgi:predicted DNA-binding antitoxin AbrB/MazE fold protein